MGEKGIGGKKGKRGMEVINKEKKRKGRNKVTEGIRMEKWKEHFMRLLGEMEGRVVRGRERRGGEKEEVEEIKREKIKDVIKVIKEGKATEIDEVPGEVWKYGG